MDPKDCRTQLSRLLADETSHLVVLQQQLLAEHVLLVANDVERLEQAAHARQETITRLLRLDDERRSLCRMLGKSPDLAGLSAVLAWCDPQGTLSQAHAECARHAQLSRDQNDRNGILVNARMNRVSGMLDLLNAGNATNTRTYEARGASRGATAPPAGRMLSTSA